MRKHAALLPFVALILALPPICRAEEEKAIDADDLFGGGGGYFHPYVVTTGMYEDNVYQTANNEISDYATIFSPGIWLALPGVREKAASPTTSPRTTGGVGVVEDHGDVLRRMKAFLHYRADMTRYEEEDSEDSDDQRFEGLLQYGLKGGLAFEAMGQYLDSHENPGESVSGAKDDYTSNLLGGRVTYDMGTRFRLRGEYSNFDVNYDSADNETRNRNDDKYGATLYYKLTGKSSILVEYNFVDISYDESPDLDSEENYMWGGYRYRLSEKTMGEVKLGYLKKEDAVEGAEGQSDFVVKGWVGYELTGKSRLKLTASRIPQEADKYGKQSALSNNVSAVLSHDLTSKIMLSLVGGYGQTTYEGGYNYDGVVGEREDDEYTAKLSLDYQIQDWLGVGASYTHVDKESNIDDLSYTNNTVLLSLTLAM